MSKQTAVEWLQEQFNRQRFIEKLDFETAKQMEKDQIMEAVSFGDCRGRVTTYLTDEEYYNEIYGK